MSLEEGTAYASPLRPQRVGGSRVTARRGLEKWGWSGGRRQPWRPRRQLGLLFSVRRETTAGLEGRDQMWSDYYVSKIYLSPWHY